MRMPFPASVPTQRGFTLVEMLVAMVVLGIMVSLIFTIGSQTNKVWTQSNQRIEQFQGARNAFESITRNVAESTLNTYYDYYGSTSPTSRRNPTSASFTPTTYGRATDLEFVSGGTAATGLSTSQQITHAIFFVAPLGYTQATASASSNPSYQAVGGPLTPLDKLLCASGYFIQYSKGLTTPSFFSNDPTANYYRFRLMQVLVPTENFPVYPSYNNTNGNLSLATNAWIAGIFSNSNYSSWVHQVASNIVALVISPEDPGYLNYRQPDATYIAENYNYDTSDPGGKITDPSFAQLPPVLHIAMVAIDEQSAMKLTSINGNSATAPTFGLNFGNLFTQAQNFETDLATLTKALSGGSASSKIQMNCRVFETRVALRESKWSGVTTLQ